MRERRPDEDLMQAPISAFFKRQSRSVVTFAKIPLLIQPSMIRVDVKHTSGFGVSVLVVDVDYMVCVWHRDAK